MRTTNIYTHDTKRKLGHKKKKKNNLQTWRARPSSIGLTFRKPTVCNSAWPPAVRLRLWRKIHTILNTRWSIFVYRIRDLIRYLWFLVFKIIQQKLWLYFSGEKIGFHTAVINTSTTDDLNYHFIIFSLFIFYAYLFSIDVNQNLKKKHKSHDYSKNIIIKGFYIS